jgi:hypothetical protein
MFSNVPLNSSINIRTASSRAYFVERFKNLKISQKAFKKENDLKLRRWLRDEKTPLVTS